MSRLVLTVFSYEFLTSPSILLEQQEHGANSGLPALANDPSASCSHSQRARDGARVIGTELSAGRKQTARAPTRPSSRGFDGLKAHTQAVQMRHHVV